MSSKRRKGGTSKAAEVAWGEAAELDILRRWMRVAELDGCEVIQSQGYADHDFLLLAKTGMPVAYVEVKKRRTLFAKYKDSICPVRKHHLGAALWSKHKIPFLLVTEHPDALIEVDLAQKPTAQKPLGRHDRPDEPAPMHAFYAGDLITILEYEESDEAEAA